MIGPMESRMFILQVKTTDFLWRQIKRQDAYLLCNR
ncbi:unknown [Porphyromonas sp. CAG:1061]|nr:unknown [Porphyromonas sp. CAG:1061]